MDGLFQHAKPVGMPVAMWDDAVVRANTRGGFRVDYDEEAVQNELSARGSEWTVEDERTRGNALQALRGLIEGENGWKHMLWESLQRVKCDDNERKEEEKEEEDGEKEEREAFDKMYRLDLAGNVIARIADHDSLLGWQIDHFFPHALGGATVESNLHLLQSRANCVVKKEALWHVVKSKLAVGIGAVAFLHAYEHGSFFGMSISLLTQKFEAAATRKLGLELKAKLEAVGFGVASPTKPKASAIKFSWERCKGMFRKNVLVNV